MRYLKRGLLWILLAAVIALSPLIAPRLPSSPEGRVKRTGSQWAGVLRFWVSEGWQPGYGSYTPWLNDRVAAFEKRNPGVYIQVTPVSREVLAQFDGGDLNPPDLLLFSPGAVTSAESLCALDMPDALRDDLRDAGISNDALHAVPVAMGGYIWVYNRRYLSDIPDDWRSLGEIAPKNKKDTVHWLNWPADSASLNWSSSLLALFYDRVQMEQAEGAPKTSPGGGLDFGLPVPTPDPAAQREVEVRQITVPCFLPEALPEDFRTAESVYSQFTRGQIAAMPATQREIRRLQVLSEDGRAPDWAAQSTGQVFTDQLAMMAVVDAPKSDGEARRAVAKKFLAHLLSEESQAALTSIRALPVIFTGTLYAGQSGMQQLEEAYSRPVTTVNAFDLSWRESAAEAADRFVVEQKNRAATDQKSAA